MIDKSLVKKRFAKSLVSYDDNAIIQKVMAKKLINMLPYRKFDSVFEAGCATGILTREIKKNIRFNQYTANDIVSNSKFYIDKIIPDNLFITADIEELYLTEKYDLIIANACLQWCNDIERTIDKLCQSLKDKGVLAVSVFGNENFKEIKNIFKIENKNYDIDNLKNHLTEYNTEIYEEITELTFETPLDVLKHIKATGVNAVKEISFTKSDLKNFEIQYINKYSKYEKAVLTYNPVYIIIRI